MSPRLVVAALALLAAAPAYAEPAGYAAFSAPAPHHAGPLAGAVLYPPAGGGAPERTAENAVFHGVDVVRDAEIAPGRHPLILLSHGMGGHHHSLTWLAAALAGRGAIVVAVNHPGSTVGDFDRDRAFDHWTRVHDLSAALDGALADPEIADHVDATRIYALGFSLGGWTALSAGGLRGDLAGYRAFCETEDQGAAHCRQAEGIGMRLAERDAARWNASYKDPRIAGVAAIDPGLHGGVGAEEVSDLVGTVLLIGLGEGAHRLIVADFGETGTGFMAQVPQASVAVFADANHFTAMPLCKPEGPALLEAEGDDPVCTDPEGADRAAVHAAIVDAVAQAFGLD